MVDVLYKQLSTQHTFSSILNRSGIVAANVLVLIQFGNILSARLEQALNGRHVVYSLQNSKQGQNNRQAQALATKDQVEILRTIKRRGMSNHFKKEEEAQSLL